MIFNSATMMRKKFNTPRDPFNSSHKRSTAGNVNQHPARRGYVSPLPAFDEVHSYLPPASIWIATLNQSGFLFASLMHTSSQSMQELGATVSFRKFWKKSAISSWENADLPSVDFNAINCFQLCFSNDFNTAPMIMKSITLCVVIIFILHEDLILIIHYSLLRFLVLTLPRFHQSAAEQLRDPLRNSSP
ncbi:hypothetical protein C8R43DRAFT_13216 [Mycena crocata]|nr:hypothetical protein C8R43DRAFT_13216 [Mycena crocata]